MNYGVGCISFVVLFLLMGLSVSNAEQWKKLSNNEKNRVVRGAMVLCVIAAIGIGLLWP